MGGALEARGIPAGDDRLIGEVEGTIEKGDGVLFIERIHVHYRLELSDPSLADAARRAHEVHHPKCPVYRTVSGCIDITTDLEFIEA